jgi:hypothetical protein
MRLRRSPPPLERRHDARHRVRIPTSTDGRTYTTDLDILTIQRAEAVLNATEEEKGPWLDENGVEVVTNR